jgi:hypothetical protein
LTSKSRKEGGGDMPYWILGLFHFRNVNHASWFFGSIGILATVIILIIFLRGKEFSWFLPPLCLFPTFHLLVSLSAVWRVILLKRPSNAFSIDCVWFNALMAVVYIGIYFAFKPKKVKKDFNQEKRIAVQSQHRIKIGCFDIENHIIGGKKMDPNEKISCLGCNWEGKLCECETHIDGNETIYSCPTCGAILM